VTVLPPPPAAPSAPPATVVIITRDRTRDLLRTLDELSRLPDAPAIVVVDNASTTGTVEAVRDAFPAVTVVPLRHNAGGFGRTVGARCAHTPLIAFSDDDSWWAPGALSHAAALFAAHPRLALAAARVLVGPEQRVDPVCEAMAAGVLGTDADLPGPSVLGFVACGAVVRREAFLDAGGFTERLGVGGEEQLLAIDLARAGWGLAYVDTLVAHHHPAALRNPRARERRMLRNDLWTAWLRRPPAAAARRTVALLRATWPDVHAWFGAAEALRALPWVLRRRDPVPAWLEARIARLEAVG
jgi:N-acetylglucosaminyl-diphospho-decaprenol L-rhamnosyltransferase